MHAGGELRVAEGECRGRVSAISSVKIGKNVRSSEISNINGTDTYSTRGFEMRMEIRMRRYTGAGLLERDMWHGIY
jgi:hypothetical protein